MTEIADGPAMTPGQRPTKCTAPGCVNGYVLLRSYPGNELFLYQCETCWGTGMVPACPKQQPTTNKEPKS